MESVTNVLFVANFRMSKFNDEVSTLNNYLIIRRSDACGRDEADYNTALNLCSEVRVLGELRRVVPQNAL